nr:immunoglobulin heavy chain junction region [Macaca mulatta]MOW99698.1 immunoglobulin heavy chain junction region [Macaca mulatta]MOX01592.1 immunoglobulin heavy chain junction region [Macaca mulatta]MOX01609.1 immunoglobulin heavy chain junction region [Macaca mulatta]MOX06653.1 immunoglobulin heavy chain junction region [Macaca mulatta]
CARGIPFSGFYCIFDLW